MYAEMSFHKCLMKCNIYIQSCDLRKVTNPEKWVAGLGLPLVWRTKPPEPPRCLILEDLQTLHIPTNTKLEVWTQYRLLLSFLGSYVLVFFRPIFRQREICTKT